MPTAILSSKGQLVIPKEIRDKLGLRAGSEVDFVVSERGDVILRPAVEDIRRLKGMLSRPGRKPVSIKQMNDTIRRRGGGRA